VRLVFLPEDSISNFGGDPDNYEFPRWALDVAFLRVYDDGKPAATPEYFAGRHRRERGDLVFMSGNPGRRSASSPWPSSGTSATWSSPNGAAAGRAARYLQDSAARTEQARIALGRCSPGEQPEAREGQWRSSPIRSSWPTGSVPRRRCGPG
jgi:hypothetical protein